MEQKTVEIRLDDEVVNYLQRLDFEIGGLRVLHTHAMNAGVSEDKTLELQQKFQETYAEYQLAKQELWAQYNDKYPTCRWWVNFQTGILHIQETDNGGEHDA